MAGVLTRERRKSDTCVEKRPCVKQGRGQSDTATSWRRNRIDAVLEPLGRAGLLTP